MPKLNLGTNDKAQEVIKAYLEENASDVLAAKINNGVPVEKDGKRLINRKTLDSFMKYACDEARKQTEKGKNSACIPDSVVFGWAVHYFEEESIEGTLYNEDGTEYKSPAPPVKTKPTASVTSSKPQSKPQMSIFDLMETPKEEPKPQPKVEIVPDDYKPTEEEIQEILAEIAAEEHQAHAQQKLELTPIVEPEKHWVNETTYVDENGVVHEVEPDDELSTEPKIAKAFNPESLCILSDLLGDSFVLR